jgi:predicted metalloprotease
MLRANILAEFGHTFVLEKCGSKREKNKNKNQQQ